MATKRQASSTQNISTVAGCVRRIKEELASAWLANIYRDRILRLRTRAYQFPSQPASNANVAVQHTLLGVELKIGRRRLLCPDLATARYLAVFARVGCKDIAVPYDITKVSQFADEFESSWHRMLLLVDHCAADLTEEQRTRTRSLLVNELRTEIKRAGPGMARPEFKQSTKQRR